MPRFIRARDSSLPRMWAISTAPPGVTALPAMAMRTGHITLAFFTPSSSARSVITCLMPTGSQGARASNRGRMVWSISREISELVLDFLWGYSATS